MADLSGSDSHSNCIAHSVVLSLDDEGGCMLHLGVLHMLDPAERQLLLTGRFQHLTVSLRRWRVQWVHRLWLTIEAVWLSEEGIVGVQSRMHRPT